jgi:hypothetical protein
MVVSENRATSYDGVREFERVCVSPRRDAKSIEGCFRFPAKALTCRYARYIVAEETGPGPCPGGLGPAPAGAIVRTAQ